jgi:hypothetical protein
LSRQDALPSEDPSWLYSWVQGQPAPIPPRTEPLLYIPNNVVDEFALKNLQPSFPEVRIIDGPLSCLQ